MERQAYLAERRARQTLLMQQFEQKRPIKLLKAYKHFAQAEAV